MRRFFYGSLLLIFILSLGWIDTLYASSERAPISGTPFLRQQRLQLLRDYSPAARIEAERQSEITVAADIVGQQINFWAYNFATETYYQDQNTIATCRNVTPFGSGYNLYIYVADAEWARAASEFTTTILGNIASEYVHNILPKETTYFGNPPTGDFTILLLDIKDSGVSTFVAGYFDPLNEPEFGTQPHSNNRHMIYIDSNPGTPGSTSSFGTFAHEFNHFIHHNFDPFEETWVEEGMAGLARVVCGYGPQVSHVNAFGLTPTTSLIIWGDTLENYGATLLFMLYIKEQYAGSDQGASITRTIIADQQIGINGINDALHQRGYPSTATADNIFKNWVIANYLNNTSISGGIYGYQTSFTDSNITNPPGNIHVGTTVSTYPASTTSKAVNQYAADYVKFSSLTGRYDTFVLIAYNLNQTDDGIENLSPVPSDPYSYNARLGSLVLNLTFASPVGMEGVAQGSSNPTPVVTSLSSSNTISTETGGRGSGGGSSSGGGGCFIATIAYGSPDRKEVSILREFRDHYLMTHAPGRFLVSLYYASSPPIAHFIGRHESLKTFSRIILYPAVGLAYWFLKDPLGAGLLSVGTFLLIGLVLIRRKTTMGPDEPSAAEPQPKKVLPGS